MGINTWVPREPIGMGFCSLEGSKEEVISDLVQKAKKKHVQKSKLYTTKANAKGQS